MGETSAPPEKSCTLLCYANCLQTFKPVNDPSSQTRLQKSVRLVLAITLGQVLSLILCGTGITSQMLACWHAVSIPTSQAFMNYLLLGVFYGIPLAVRKDFLTVLRMHWWRYIILGIIDVEANFLVILAYRYTSLISIQLLDSFTIACVMLLSFVFLRMRYKVINFMGVLLSVIGIASLVLADLKAVGCSSAQATNQLLGDLLCLLGVALYAVGNVAQEYLVKKHSITEYLGLIGIVGSVVSAVQLIVLERNEVAKIEWSQNIGLLLSGFGLLLFMFYSLIPHAMKVSSALVVNLSLLTANVYSVLFGVYLFHFKVTPLYVLSLVIIISGLLIYNLRPPSVGKKERQNQDQENTASDKADRHAANETNVFHRLLESQSVELAGHRSRTTTRASDGSEYGSIETMSPTS